MHALAGFLLSLHPHFFPRGVFNATHMLQTNSLDVSAGCGGAAYVKKKKDPDNRRQMFSSIAHLAEEELNRSHVF